jgi:signal transduction histidine kinase
MVGDETTSVPAAGSIGRGGEPQWPGRSSSPPVATAETRQAATVLIVEDSLVNRRTLSRGVQNEGLRTLEAVDGAEALRLLAEHPVDMVVLDLLMPEVDGFEVLATMSRDHDLKDIPVLVVSAVEESGDVARAIEMGAIDCLSKPVDPVLLRVRLRTALERVRLRRLERSYLRQELALRQQERLATLGRLSAGLGHELNNPAGAALSATRQLQRTLAEAEEIRTALLARADGAGIVASVDHHLADRSPAFIAAPDVTGPPAPAPGPGSVDVADVTGPFAAEGRPAPAGLTAAQRADLADQLATDLTAAGVEQPWTHAEVLAAEGVSPKVVRALVAELGDGVELGLAWYHNRTEVRAILGRITTSLQRIAELTAALRGYSYLDRAPQQDLDVRVGIEDTLRILAHKTPAEVQVVRAFEPGLPTVHGYGGQLNQVWTNLLDNAIQAVGASGRVIVRATPVDEDEDGVVVDVEDDGPGIDPDLLGAVFDPFVTTKPPGEGTGLGLSIAHQIVTEGHGGALTVESEPGRTLFRVRLPSRPTPDTASSVTSSPPPADESSLDTVPGIDRQRDERPGAGQP